jgi:hypothetical protein
MEAMLLAAIVALMASVIYFALMCKYNSMDHWS